MATELMELGLISHKFQLIKIRIYMIHRIANAKNRFLVNHNMCVDRVML